MKRIVILLVMLILPIFLFAEEGEKGVKPEDVKLGTVKLKLNSEFAKAYVDGQVWDDNEFEANGKTMYLYKIDRTKEVKIRLEPVMDPTLAPVEITIKPKDWKLKRIKPLVREWRVFKKIKFKKKKTNKKSKSKK